MVAPVMFLLTDKVRSDATVVPRRNAPVLLKRALSVPSTLNEIIERAVALPGSALRVKEPSVLELISP
jgi:hypothetical protein